MSEHDIVKRSQEQAELRAEEDAARKFFPRLELELAPGAGVSRLLELPEGHWCEVADGAKPPIYVYVASLLEQRIAVKVTIELLPDDEG